MKQNLIRLIFCSIFLLIGHLTYAQEKEIRGTVISKIDGFPIPGVSVIVKGTATGTQTDMDGNYRLSAAAGDILSFSYLGMTTVEITVGDSDVIDVQLDEDATALGEIVVTALGIKKTRESLTYAAQDINSKELTTVKQTNPITSLSGKVAGMAVTRSSSGTGGSAKVVLRGNASLGNNQPLYVIDGIPLQNIGGSQPSDTFGDVNGGNRDGGDALSLINPDDIESVTVLKGASASSLYGSGGLNGVIVITTKRGRSGGFRVNFNSNITVDNAAYYMDFNKSTEDNIDDFFNTGYTNINSITVSGGTENAQTYFSFANSNASGIIPTNKLRQNTFNIRETAQMFNNKLKLSASVMGSIQDIENRPISGLYFNPLVGVYGFEAENERLSDYEVFEALDPDRNIMAQRWWRATSDIEQNPYWILNRNKSYDTNSKLVANLSLNYQVNDWLSLQTRGTYDRSQLDYERKIYATTEATLAPLNGRYILNEFDNTQYYMDFIANINKDISEKISFNAILGTSTQRNTSETFVADSGTNGGLQFANVFALQNFQANPQVSFTQQSFESRTNSVFTSATLGFSEKVYVDLTARNDWVSTIPKPENSFLYGSVGVTGILTNLFDLGDKVSFAKVRASYGEVGNGFGPDQISPNRAIIFGQGVSPFTPIRPYPGTTPKPERQRSFEIGTEWRFDNDRYGFDLGYYRTSTINQYFAVPIAPSNPVGLDAAGINSGDILNSGVELTAYAIPVQNDNFTWRTTVNFATNKNEVKKLFNSSIDGLGNLDFVTISPRGVNTFGSYLEQGGAFGDIYAQVVRRDENGLPVVDVDNDNAIVMDDDELVDGLTKVGNANPDWTLGWSNSFTYKNFSLTFLVDGKFGGETVSMTEAVVEGLSNNSARETANGSVNVVDLNGNPTTISAQEYYGKVGGRNGYTGEYVYSATNVRLAELALGYNFNLGSNSFFTNIKASLVGNNLFFFYKDAPHDPNVSLSTGNALQGVDVLGLPSTRSLGLNINLTF